MKKTLSAVLAASMILTLTACGGSSSQSAAPAAGAAASEATSAFENLEPVELLVADSAAPSTAIVLFENSVAEKVAEKTGGKLTMDIHSGGELGGDADLIRQLQGGDIDALGCQIAPAVAFIPELAVFDLPMVFAKYDGDTIENVLNGSGEFRTAISKAYETNGLHLLGFLQNATYRLTTSNTELKDLASFKGLKIRTMENANHMAFWTAIGAEPTPLAWGEVYISLQNGTIDAEENAADTVAGANFQEVQKYLAFTNHILYCNQLAINKDKWESLDPAYQAALEQAMTQTLADMSAKLKDIDASNKKALEEKGMTMIEYPDSFYDEVLALDGVKALYAELFPEGIEEED